MIVASVTREFGEPMFLLWTMTSSIHHPFSMLVAGPGGAEESEFVKQLISLKRYIMTNCCLLLP